MYSYYAWAAMGFSFPAKPLITGLQLIQVGCVYAACVLFLKQSTCNGKTPTVHC